MQFITLRSMQGLLLFLDIRHSDRHLASDKFSQLSQKFRLVDVADRTVDNQLENIASRGKKSQKNADYMELNQFQTRDRLDLQTHVGQSLDHNCFSVGSHKTTKPLSPTPFFYPTPLFDQRTTWSVVFSLSIIPIALRCERFMFCKVFIQFTFFYTAFSVIYFARIISVTIIRCISIPYYVMSCIVMILNLCSNTKTPDSLPRLLP